MWIELPSIWCEETWPDHRAWARDIAEGERDAALRELTGADDPEAVEPPIVETFTTEHLGEGLRTLRYCPFDPGPNAPPDPGAIFATLSYAWRVDEHDTDVTRTASKETSLRQAFNDRATRERLAREAWVRGKNAKDAQELETHDFGTPVGTGPSGGSQSRVRVHMDRKSHIHGHPSGPESP